MHVGGFVSFYFSHFNCMQIIVNCCGFVFCAGQTVRSYIDNTLTKGYNVFLMVKVKLNFDKIMFRSNLID